MFSIILLTAFLFIMILSGNADAQFKIHLPSENGIVTGISYSVWNAKNKSDYNGKYSYCKDDFSNMKAGYATVSNSEKEITINVNNTYSDGNTNSESAKLKVSGNKFTSTSYISGSFAKLKYKDKNGNTKTANGLWIDGDCCDGACDVFYEKVE